jgi:hypothetical protein
MKKLFVGIIILAIFGFVGYKFMMQANDLGVKADTAFVTAFEEKYGKPNGTGKIDLDVTLTSEEITSVFAVWQERDKNFPLRDVQIKFNSDGTGEASGYLKVESAINLAKNLGYSDSDIEKGKDYIKYVSGDLPFYVKGTGEMINNKITVNPASFQIAKISVPDNIITPASLLVTDMINKRINQIGGADIKEASFKTGVFKLQGLVPETIKY